MGILQSGFDTYQIQTSKVFEKTFVTAKMGTFYVWIRAYALNVWIEKRGQGLEITTKRSRALNNFVNMPLVT